MAEDFTTKIAKVQHLSQFNRTGTVDKITQVTFFVGSYGPFSKDFPEGADAPAQINAHMDSKATEVRQIVQRS